MATGQTRTEFMEEVGVSSARLADKAYIAKLEAENRLLRSQQGTDNMLFDHVKDAIVGFEPPPKIKYNRPALKHDDLHAVLVTTDQHAEEVVRPEEMEGLSEYNWDIFTKRMVSTSSKTIELTNIMRQASQVPVLDIWSLGDWFCGKIHPQEESYGLSMPMPVAVPKVGMQFAQMITELSGHFDKVRVFCMCGNHGRDSKKPVTKMTADRNWDMSVYLIAQGYTEKLENVEWNIPQSIMTIADVEGWPCLLTHSGEVNMNNRTPYYPIESTFDQEHKIRTGTDKDFAYAFMGHWHHHAMLAGNIYLCPSLIGNNQFSRFKLHKVSVPEQLLCFFTEKRGMINQWPIKLADVI